MIDLGTLGGGYSVASDINNHGQIAGQERGTRVGQSWAVVWMNTGVPGPSKTSARSPARAAPMRTASITEAQADPNTVGRRWGPVRAYAVVWDEVRDGWVIQDLGKLPGDMSQLCRRCQRSRSRSLAGAAARRPASPAGFRGPRPLGMFRLSGSGRRKTWGPVINNSGDVAGFSTDASGIVMRSAGDPPLTGRLKISERSAAAAAKPTASTVMETSWVSAISAGDAPVRSTHSLRTWRG